MKSSNALAWGLGGFGAAALAGALLFSMNLKQAEARLQALPPITVMDQAVTLAEQQYQAFTYQPPTPADLTLEVTNVGGTPMDVFVMDRTNFLRFQAGSDFSYLAAPSRRSVQGEFLSPMFQPVDDGPLYVMVRPTDVRDGQWSSSAARVVLKARPIV